MPLELTLGVVHAAVALTTLLAAVGVTRRRREPTGARVDPGATGWLVVALGSVTLWSAHLAWYWLLGASAAQVLWLPAVGASFAAVLAWSVAMVRPGAARVRIWGPVVLADAVLLLVAQLVLGAESVVVRTDSSITYGSAYGLHVLLCLALLLGAASVWIGCRQDPSRTVRLLAHVVLTGLVAAGALEVLQLRLMNVAVSAMLVVVAVVLVRADPTQLRARPEPGPLLDDLGALVLVHDRDGLLVDLNAPARAFFADSRGRAPRVGTPIADLLPVSVTDAVDGAEVRLDGPDGPTDFTCFAARLSASTTPPDGSIVVLRPRTSATPDADGAATTTVELERRVQQVAAASNDLVALGVRFECRDDAARAARAVEFVVGSLGSMTICPLDERTWLAVAPGHLEPVLVDVASGWQSRSTPIEPGDEAPRSVSLAPVLAGDLVVRRGASSQVTALVDTVREALAGIGQ